MAMKEKLVVPVEIPTWGVLSAIVMGAFAWGALYTQLNGLIKGQEKVDVMYERQIKNIEAVNAHKETLREHAARLQNHDSRLQSLERLAERGK